MAYRREETEVNHLYINIPFCNPTCRFCNFYKNDIGLPDRFEGLEESEKFGEAIAREYKLYSSQIPLSLETLYMGGGTPALLAAENYSRIFQMLEEDRQPVALSNEDNEHEITFELNPTASQDISKIMNGWINRLSVGIQSFSSRSLERLGREISADPQYLKDLRKYVHNISVDMIFDIPGQSKQEIEEDVSRILELNPEHISYYSLELREGEKHAEITDYNEELFPWAYDFITNKLKDSGLQKYELSNFSKPDCQSKHNLAYWEGKHYLGLGPGAMGAIHLPDRDHPVRYRNTKNVEDYFQKTEKGELPWEFSEELTPRVLINETIFNQLRLKKGLNLDKFHKKHKYDFIEKYSIPLKKHANMFEINNRAVKLSERGLLYYNYICSDFMELEL